MLGTKTEKLFLFWSSLRCFLVNRFVNFNKVANLTFINKEFILSKKRNMEPVGSEEGSILLDFLLVVGDLGVVC